MILSPAIFAEAEIPFNLVMEEQIDGARVSREKATERKRRDEQEARQGQLFE